MLYPMIGVRMVSWKEILSLILEKIESVVDGVGKDRREKWGGGGR